MNTNTSTTKQGKFRSVIKSKIPGQERKAKNAIHDDEKMNKQNFSESKPRDDTMKCR